MTILKILIPSNIKERFKIKDIRATEFAVRLQGHMDENKKGLLSGSKSDFFGTVNKNNFKIRTNKIIKSEDLAIYGEFHDDENGLILDIEYSRSTFERIVPIGLIILLFYLTVRSISDNEMHLGFLLFVTIFLVGFIVASHISKASEIEKLSRTLKKIFDDKEIIEVNER